MKKFFCKIISAFIFSKTLRRKFKTACGLRKEREVKEYYGKRKIYAEEEAQKLILDQLKTGKPCLIGRFGGTEFNAFKQWCWIAKGRQKKYTDKIINELANSSGFFPSNPENISRFARALKKVVEKADIMAVWNIPDEEEIMDEFCEKAKFIKRESFIPVIFEEPWSQYLEGKKVLVIHPFEKSIIAQYEKREKLFDNPKVLPKFKLKTIKAVQSIADAKDDVPFKDWFEALEYMKKEIDKVDFDVAIIGAGAYGIFLAEHCKKIGKQGIHLAGVTQILFGIYGKRWVENRHADDSESVAIRKLINDNWCLPLEDEKPKGAEKVERGAYW